MTEDQLYNIMRSLDFDKDGKLSLDEFKAAFGDPDREAQLALLDSVRVEDYESIVIPPRPIKELYDEGSAGAAGGDDVGAFGALFGRKKASSVKVDAIPSSVVGKFRLKLKPVADYAKVWTSQGSMSKMNVSVWMPDVEGSILKQNRVKLCLGMYANEGFEKPSQSKSGGFFGGGNRGSAASLHGERLTVEIKDEGRWGMAGQSPYMRALVDALMPHPVRFQEVWRQQRGAVVFAWKPVPPSKEFVALGMVITTTEDPPDVASVRCLPRHWCAPASIKPKKVWEDAGASGGKKGSIWIVNTMQLIAVSASHDEPQGEFWELIKSPVHMSVKDLAVVQQSAAAAAAEAAEAQRRLEEKQQRAQQEQQQEQPLQPRRGLPAVRQDLFSKSADGKPRPSLVAAEYTPPPPRPKTPPPAPVVQYLDHANPVAMLEQRRYSGQAPSPKGPPLATSAPPRRAAPAPLPAGAGGVPHEPPAKKFAPAPEVAVSAPTPLRPAPPVSAGVAPTPPRPSRSAREALGADRGDGAPAAPIPPRPELARRNSSRPPAPPPPPPAAAGGTTAPVSVPARPSVPVSQPPPAGAGLGQGQPATMAEQMAVALQKRKEQQGENQ